MRTEELGFERPPELQATHPPESRGLERDGVRLLVSSGGHHEHARFRDLPRFLVPGTVLVVNRSATLPASLPAAGPIGRFRLNLSTRYGGLWLAEPRWGASEPGPLPLAAGDALEVADLPARLIAAYPGRPRLWFVRIEGDVSKAMARAGEPIRYGYIAPPFPPLADYQTAFADVPGGAEMPSAARPFTPRVIDALRKKGIQLVSVVLHTGVSSLEVEEESIEDHAPLPEPFFVPRETADAINAAREHGRPVVAVGTTVVRALESAWSGARVRPVSGFTRKYVGPGRGVNVVDGLLTGFHDPRASHLALLSAVAPPGAIRSAYREAVHEGYLWHEFGDSHLVKSHDDRPGNRSPSRGSRRASRAIAPAARREIGSFHPGRSWRRSTAPAGDDARSRDDHTDSAKSPGRPARRGGPSSVEDRLVGHRPPKWAGTERGRTDPGTRPAIRSRPRR